MIQKIESELYCLIEKEDNVIVNQSFFNESIMSVIRILVGWYPQAKSFYIFRSAEWAKSKTLSKAVISYQG